MKQDWENIENAPEWAMEAGQASIDSMKITEDEMEEFYMARLYKKTKEDPLPTIAVGLLSKLHITGFLPKAGQFEEIYMLTLIAVGMNRYHEAMKEKEKNGKN